ncbi:hypothetical protein BAZ12_00730 [Elizabethkingia miricola]|uniref:hypothetical protein n=1 Tax=Elizabethkingia TaxID=308865 RepID=UPI0008408845|nr:MULTISPECIES: hypothetical protein [Elizabethkingia]DAP61732.1 MAG TPA: hypothetical protein [Caudoviricetes sp.]MCL1652592.1 hypothetical protein [Elizabethkingia miricola]OCW73156.1 hypothetical protein A4G24_15890 [Elizabethkingia anophelis]OPC71139.1 hypothetical protein BAZ13_09830 [Elizabethkingia miricola]OPC75600.1 hypothetical protein BAZ12_00730 [Elizabethkingia miricola]
MSKTFKNVFAAAAFAIFNTHKELDLIHVTSDGQGFTKDNKNKAHDHARYLKDDRVETFERGFEDAYSEPEEADALETEEDIEPDPADVQNTEQTPETEKQTDSLNTGDGIEPGAAEKNDLISKYKELYGVAPVHNISLEKLKAKVEEKEAEGKQSGTDTETVEKKEASEDKGATEQPEA